MDPSYAGDLRFTNDQWMEFLLLLLLLLLFLKLFMSLLQLLWWNPDGNATGLTITFCWAFKTKAGSSSNNHYNYYYNNNNTWVHQRLSTFVWTFGPKMMKLSATWHWWLFWTRRESFRELVNHNGQGSSEGVVATVEEVVGATHANINHHIGIHHQNLMK